MFDSMILNMLEDMRDNPERMLHKLGIKNKKKAVKIDNIYKDLGK